MAGFKGWIQNKFINDYSRLKATIKYEIRLQETHLKRLMIESKVNHLDVHAAASICAKLACEYEALLKKILPSKNITKDAVIFFCEDTPARCYAQIQKIKEESNILLSTEQEVAYCKQLKDYYVYLESLLLNIQSQEHLVESNVALSSNLQDLLAIDSPEQWLIAAINFANDVGENVVLSLGLFAQLKDSDLLSLANLFEEPLFVLYVNSIFFYKFNPEALFEETLYPEKLMSVRTRLSMLHHFLEMIHQTVKYNLNLRKIGEFKDYLFHGDELPKGVSLVKEEVVRDFIRNAIKKWRAVHLENSSELIILNKINELFRAYKFWFNPNRLIDTAMALKRQIFTFNSKSHDKQFILRVQSIYQQLTTTQCLDLYGYFANKDSNYLMRVLLALSQGITTSSLAEIPINHKTLFEEVYHVLNAIMEALRNELFDRKINTVPYERTLDSEALRPGARNLNAMKRIVELYACEENNESNDKLAGLFSEMESQLGDIRL